ncbi:MAG: polymerase sigma-70 factor, subfamily [Mycobacterium sp.]|jgi:RNA polymerase sigma-70 factor (ECF subfamily)|nr:polymerase sigma-70 factor, subfamily [Mycobacterium sp.]
MEMSDISLAGDWQRHRPYLVNLAYQMLGDIGDAEDVAQESFLRLARADEVIDDVRAWLTVVVGRLSLDLVRSARHRYESPTEATILEERSAAAVDPADRVTLDDQVSGALMHVLQRLSPGERVALVLHDVFKVPFDEIAQTVGRPAGTCRQLARRARAKIRAVGPSVTDVSHDDHVEVMQKFIAACATGDLAALASVLDPSVWGAATLLGDPTPPQQINHGPHDVATNLLRHVGPGVTLVGAPVGQPVLLGYARRRLFAVLVLTIHDGRVLKIEATADPSARFN